MRRKWKGGLYSQIFTFYFYLPLKRYYQDDSSTDGVYWVYPDEEEPFQVLCDMKTDVEGWTTFQRRMDGSVDFYVDWDSYKKASEIWRASFG